MVQVQEAATALATRGMPVAAAHFHTVRPFDGQTFERATAACDTVIITEDHGERGGLGEIIPVHVQRSGRTLRLVRLGPVLQDKELHVLTATLAETVHRQLPK